MVSSLKLIPPLVDPDTCLAARNCIGDKGIKIAIVLIKVSQFNSMRLLEFPEGLAAIGEIVKSPRFDPESIWLVE